MPKRISIDVSPEEHRQLKAILASRGNTITGWFRGYMEALFREDNKRKEKGLAKSIYPIEVNGQTIRNPEHGRNYNGHSNDRTR